jgi:type II secretory ATPase GspE/PulE/Tfp pilus assembly ATPase PilB-like protein
MMSDQVPPFARILFAAHPDQPVQRGLSRAISLARQLQAELHVFRVLPGPSASASDADLATTRRTAKEELATLISPSEVMELSIRWEVSFGEAADEILQYAKQADIDLVVLGTQPRGRWSRFFFGSVADKVYRQASCPVLAVPSERPAGEEPSEQGSESPEWHPTELAEREPAAPAYDLLERAIRLRSTDIHIDPVADDEFAIRFRIDGRLEHYCTLDDDVGERLIKQFKTLASLDIAEPFKSQEGYLRLPSGMVGVQIRITTAPVQGGEAICLRVHEQLRMFRALENLGLSTHATEVMAEMLRRREGLIVVAGPTGSGKTTTVYSMLDGLRSDGRQLLIASIEDPVEFNVAFLRQMSVDEQHGMTWNHGLRTMLRLDSDVLFLGEIRGGETADTAMRAAGSGRYVFTTLHSRGIPSAVIALEDQGVDRRSLSANLTGIISQRLIRRLCPNCRKRRPILDNERRVFEDHQRLPPTELWVPQGCDDCRGIGYRDRTGVFEALIVKDAFRQAMEQGAAEDELRAAIRAEGTPSLTDDALTKAEQGISTLEEALELRAL